MPTPAERRAQLSAWAEEREITLIFFDPPEYFDHAILGVVHGAGQEPAVLYDQAKVLAAMRADMSGGDQGEDDAWDWFTFNTLGASLGEATPRFLECPWQEDPDAADT